MSEEIKDLFQRENIITMKKELSRLAESQTEQKKEEILGVKKEKRKESYAPLAPVPNIPVPAPKPEEEPEMDESQKLGAKFAKIKKDQEEENRKENERNQKKAEEEKKIEEEKLKEKKRAEEEKLKEQKKEEEEKKRKEDEQKRAEEEKKRIDQILAAVPVAPAAPTWPSRQPIPVPAAPEKASGDSYKESIEETKTEGDPTLFKNAVRSFRLQTKVKIQPPAQAAQPQSVKTPIKVELKLPPKFQEKNTAPQSVQIKKVDLEKLPEKPVPQKEQIKTEEAAMAPKPVLADQIPDIFDEKKFIESLDAREKEIEKETVKINQEKIPVKLRVEEISKEIEKTKQTQLQKISGEELEIEKNLRQLEEKERSAVSAEEKRAAEAERQSIESQREEIEAKRYQAEDSIASLETQLDECKKNYERIGEKEKKLAKEKEGIKNKREMVSLRKKKEQLEKENGKMEEELDALRNDLSSVLKRKDESDEGLKEISQIEKEIEARLSTLESQESSTSDPSLRREIESQRKIPAGQRKEIETKRWALEDKNKEIIAKENEIKRQYQVLTKRSEESKKELASINDRLNQING